MNVENRHKPAYNLPLIGLYLLIWNICVSIKFKIILLFLETILRVLFFKQFHPSSNFLAGI